jgi:putative tryptophan/tyrosine transport system substrate-binding protein
MRRRDFITLVGGGAAVRPLTARAQQFAGPVRQITVCIGRTEDAEGQRHAAAFREGLEALGWINGRNVRTDYFWVRGDTDQLRAVVRQAIEHKPEVIVVETTPAVSAFLRESGTIPIVFVNVSDPVGSGFIANLAHPGGTVTGFTSNEPTLGDKWPELLKEVAPDVKRVGFMFNPDTSPHAGAFLRTTEAAATAIGIDVAASRIHDDADIDRTIAALGREPGGGLIVLPEPTTNVRSAPIIDAAARYRVPAVYAFRFQASAGGLLSYGVDLADSFRGAASYVDHILRGEKPADLPVQAPTRFKLVVNLRTAKALGLTVPTSTLLRADEVIE